MRRQRQWQVRREVTPHPDGQRRWDRAYQQLLRGSPPASAATPQATPATTTHPPPEQEDK